jgi:hypothetical protein
MQDTIRVSRIQTVQNLKDGIHCFVHSRRAILLHAFAECTRAHRLHHDDRTFLDFFAAEDVDRVGVIDGGGKPAFAQERLRSISDPSRWRMTLSATCRPESICSASYTSPMPP